MKKHVMAELLRRVRDRCILVGDGGHLSLSENVTIPRSLFDEINETIAALEESAAADIFYLQLGETVKDDLEEGDEE